MTKSKHLKTDFNAEKSVVGFPFFARFFFEEIEEKDLKTVLKKEQRSHLHLQILFFFGFPNNMDKNEMEMKFVFGFLDWITVGHLKNGFFGTEIHFLVSSYTAKFQKRYFKI